VDVQHLVNLVLSKNLTLKESTLLINVIKKIKVILIRNARRFAVIVVLLPAVVIDTEEQNLVPVLVPVLIKMIYFLR